ncbi:MAG: hypothetical protein UY16_C0019G0003 [Candidatus Gottesmanbacteria bacterium GW2011_GWA2_47_9]|uniref:EamA domain-containing protein n=2 Tax=Candidatus Gottesmaniibacteriota TaxID=1752720 RepID=A0A0G1XNE7_9BACT|nr:MAG: hypothetical protein UY16_C0019G0003 [Candidatus Gottesmanbacteria bacterium GW2011_GWA2_47_9]KKU95860.1 MAG: hypothetical protein UY27_C0007G0028 [Candidatus Gottesmanbacteria bacterium GW2011_GWA1_48_13]
MSKGFIFTFLSALSWAVQILLIRYLLSNGETAPNLAFWFTLLATPYWISTFTKHHSKLQNVKFSLWILLLFIGLVNMIGVVFVETLALKFSPAVNFSFLIRTVILFTILLASFFLHEILSFKKVILSSLILIGSYLLITQGQTLRLTSGDMFTLLEAFMLAVLNVTQKTAITTIGPQLTASGAFLSAIIPYSIFMLVRGGIMLPKFPLVTILLTITYISITRFKLTALKHASASYVTMIFSFTPIFVSLFAIPLLGETLTTIQIIGGILIILAGVGVEKLKI